MCTAPINVIKTGALNTKIKIAQEDYRLVTLVEHPSCLPTCSVTSRIHFHRRIACKIAQYGPLPVPSGPWTTRSLCLLKRSPFAQKNWHVGTTILHAESGRTARIHGPPPCVGLSIHQSASSTTQSGSAMNRSGKNWFYSDCPNNCPVTLFLNHKLHKKEDQEDPLLAVSCRNAIFRWSQLQ